MNESQRHRGPDDAGVLGATHEHGVVAIGCTRLAMQDLSPAGHQPMIDVTTGAGVVLNGEVYNFKHLGAQLRVLGRRFVSGSDAEVVLHSYLEWGIEEAVRRFRGMFAFVLWDPRTASVFLVRDRLGVKPLYLTSTTEGFLFASEVRTLLRAAPALHRLSLSGVCRYLTLGAVQDPGTLVAGIRAVDAGSIVRIRNQRATTTVYWDLPSQFQRHREVQDPSARVREKLFEAVQLRLVSDAPTGVFLSGGIDSTAVTALAAAQQSGIKTISLVFEEAAFSERHYIEAVVRRYNTEHHQVQLRGDELLRLLPQAITAMDQPTFDGINTYVVAKVARDAGLKAALSGIGGDELFGGYPTFSRVPRLNRLRSLPVARLSAPVIRLLSMWPRDDQWRKLHRWAGESDLDEGGAYALMRELFGPSDRSRLAPATAGYRPLALAEVGRIDLFNAISELELSHYMRNVLLRDADFMGMAHGLEIREPLLDHELVELVASLPPSVKMKGPGAKPLMAAALSDLVPPEVRRRRKAGFVLPFREWMRGALRGEVESVLRDPGYGGQVADVLSPTAVNELWERFMGGRAHWTRPWALYVLKVWGQQHL